VAELSTYLATARGMTVFRASARGEGAGAGRLVAEVSLATALSALAVGIGSILLIPLVFGDAFRDARHLVAILLPGMIGLGLMRVLGNRISGQGRPGVVALIAVVQAAALVAGYLIAIPGGGANAAAIVSTVGYVLGGVVCAVLALRLEPAPGAATGRVAAPRSGSSAAGS
jgi:O-antigen/teichoic acid export membrane protein